MTFLSIVPSSITVGVIDSLFLILFGNSSRSLSTFSRPINVPSFLTPSQRTPPFELAKAHNIFRYSSRQYLLNSTECDSISFMLMKFIAYIHAPLHGQLNTLSCFNSYILPLPCFLEKCLPSPVGRVFESGYGVERA